MRTKNLWHIQRRSPVGGDLTGGRSAYLGLCKSESWFSILIIDTQIMVDVRMGVIVLIF